MAQALNQHEHGATVYRRVLKKFGHPRGVFAAGTKMAWAWAAVHGIGLSLAAATFETKACPPAGGVKVLLRRLGHGDGLEEFGDFFIGEFGFPLGDFANGLAFGGGGFGDFGGGVVPDHRR